MNEEKFMLVPIPQLYPKPKEGESFTIEYSNQELATTIRAKPEQVSHDDSLTNHIADVSKMVEPVMYVNGNDLKDLQLHDRGVLMCESKPSGHFQTPLYTQAQQVSRDDVLEDAAKVCDKIAKYSHHCSEHAMACEEAAEAIRAMKSKEAATVQQLLTVDDDRKKFED